MVIICGLSGQLTHLGSPIPDAGTGGRSAIKGPIKYEAVFEMTLLGQKSHGPILKNIATPNPCPWKYQFIKLDKRMTYVHLFFFLVCAFFISNLGSSDEDSLC